MDLRYAHAFIEAASFLHFGKAAQKLSIAPSALTRQIQLFEDSVGESLFVRSNRKVVLTPKGKELLVRLTNLLAHEQRALLKVRVGGLAGVIDNHFWPIMKKMIKSENIHLKIVESTSAPAIESLLEGELDIAFVNEKIPNDLIKYYPLGKEELVLISKQRINQKDLAEYPWIYCGHGSKLRSLSKVESSVKIQVSSINKILDLVEADVGIGVVPLSEKLSHRQFQISSLPVKNRNTFLAVLAYKVPPSSLQKIIEKISVF